MEMYRSGRLRPRTATKSPGCIPNSINPRAKFSASSKALAHDQVCQIPNSFSLKAAKLPKLAAFLRNKAGNDTILSVPVLGFNNAISSQ